MLTNANIVPLEEQSEPTLGVRARRTRRPLVAHAWDLWKEMSTDEREDLLTLISVYTSDKTLLFSPEMGSRR